ncbi:hypothetical protein XMIN_715 [Xanthomonas citri pv. mangiferaeindicae LMG 941]|nr:hypothetical protein XAR_4243 [Xanthomonas citri pv. glycines str. 8ra]CCG35757.1 hypothetical protein XMIN_715 [Xanthomonas citri pv. mangiferaeindicae LMG 941]
MRPPHRQLVNIERDQRATQPRSISRSAVTLSPTQMHCRSTRYAPQSAFTQMRRTIRIYPDAIRR